MTRAHVVVAKSSKNVMGNADKFMPSYIIQQPEPADAEAMLNHIRKIADEPNNGIALSSSSELTQTVERQQEFIVGALESDDRVIFVARTDDGIIGTLNCSNKSGGYSHTFSLGITVRKEWRNQGVGTALMQRLIQWCKNNPKCHRLELQVFSNNPRAIHVYEKLGFKQEGTRQEAFYKHGEYLDLVFMGMVFK